MKTQAERIIELEAEVERAHERGVALCETLAGMVVMLAEAVIKPDFAPPTGQTRKAWAMGAMHIVAPILLDSKENSN